MTNPNEKQCDQLGLFGDDTDSDQRTELSELIRVWEREKHPTVKKKLKSAIVTLIEIKERQAFLARYRMRDFASWNQVLSDDEGAVSKAHKANFYEPHLIRTLYENNACLPPLDAIAETVERIKDQLTLADYKLTPSKRFRYDKNIRYLVEYLKKQGIISRKKKYKNKYWALTEKGRQYAQTLKQP